MACRVVGIPHEHTGDAGIQADGHETGHGEAGLGRGDIGNDGVAYDGDGQGEEHDDTSKFEAVGEEGDGDFEGEGNRLAWCFCITEDGVAFILPVTGVATA